MAGGPVRAGRGGLPEERGTRRLLGPEACGPQGWPSGVLATGVIATAHMTVRDLPGVSGLVHVSPSCRGDAHGGDGEAEARGAGPQQVQVNETQASPGCPVAMLRLPQGPDSRAVPRPPSPVPGCGGVVLPHEAAWVTCRRPSSSCRTSRSRDSDTVAAPQRPALPGPLPPPPGSPGRSRPLPGPAAGRLGRSYRFAGQLISPPMNDGGGFLHH